MSGSEILNLVATGTILGRVEGELTNDAHCVHLGGGWGAGYELSYSSFPYTVPGGKKAQITMVGLVNKFAQDPWTQRHVYVVYDFGWTVAAHHPEWHFDPPIELPAGTVIDGTIMNGQQETQNMIVCLRGYIVDG